MDDQQLRISLEMGRTFSFLEYHSDALVKASDPSIFTTPFSFLRKVEIENLTDQDIVGATLALEFSNPIFSCDPLPLPGLPSHQETVLNPLPSISIDRKALYALTESDVCEITAKVLSSDGNVIFTTHRSAKLLPISMPSEDPEARDALMTKYVITDFPEMSLIHHMAIEENGGRPLIGYQNTRYDGSIDSDAIVHEVECIYKALHKYGITYANPPHSSEVFQKVRLPMTVLKDRLGTCLDLAILCCACISEIGIRSILFLEKEHAYSGFFLDEKTQYVPVEKNLSIVLNQVTGTKKIVVPFETTLISSESNASFAAAIQSATDRLKSHQPGFKAIDIDFCHTGAYKPLPVPKDEEANIDFTIEPTAISETALTSIRDYQFRPINSGEEQNRFTTWEKKLLDLSAGNKLVNFKFAKGNSNCIMFPKQDGKALYDYLRFSEKNNFKIRFLQGNEKELIGVTQETTDELRAQNILLAYGSPTVLKKLIRASNSSKEETGSPTLYLALASITNEKLKMTAPLLLLPVSVTKDRLGEDFTAEFDFDDLMLNKTFFEYCKLKTGVDYSSVYGLSGNDEFNDIVNTIQQMTVGSLSIDSQCFFLANFTFSHYVMWSDIHNRRDELQANPVVASLLKNESEIVNEESEETSDLDQLDEMSSFAAPLPYDSTQLKAIVEAGKGNSFILDGPPGTGKSQTIVNMIINAFYHGKTVLFIAEKMAALNVVRNRLEKLGLSRFALELYSNKANKASVFNQLGESLNLGAQASAGDFEGKCLEIKNRKKELGQELKKLHRKNGLYYSLYEAINNRLLSNEAAGKISLDEDFASSYDGPKDVTIRAALSDIHSLADSIPNFDASPLKRLKIHKFDYTDQTELVLKYQVLQSALRDLKGAYEAFAGSASVTKTPNRRQFQDIILIYGLTFRGSIRGDALIETDVFKNDTLNLEALNLILDLGAIQEKWAKKFKPDVFTAIDAAELNAFIEANSGLFAKGKVKKRFTREIEPFAVMPKPSFDDCRALVSAAVEFQAKKKNAEMREKDLTTFFGSDILKEKVYENVADKIKMYRETSELYHLIENYENGEQLPQRIVRFMTILQAKAQLFQSKLLLEEVERKFEIYKAAEDNAIASYPFEIEGGDSTEFLGSISSLLEECLKPESAKPIASAAQINARCDILREHGLSALANGFVRGEIAIDEIDDAFENALDNAFIRLYFRDPYYNQFSSALYESKIESYQELIQEYNSLAVAEVTAKVTENFINPKIDHKASTPIGALRKLVASGGRGITIRNALKKYESYFRSYFPVFMMSPLSAAQYLDVDSRKFDLIIFDEASQIPTSEAVGPIARGNALIVAGDPQQMPPTNYFSVSLNSDDVDDAGLEEFQDSESLLDDCISIGMPRIRLCFHYRSKHQSLIEFSNQNFYRGDLFTFPSFDTLSSHISFKLVAASKKDNGLSKEEIDAVLSTLKEIITSPTDRGKSVGIIVFNIKQQAKLQDEIDRFFDANKELASIVAEWEDPLFVKNLENVQGDERDIIILSVGFNKNASGKAEVRGPLILDKGERRLNVAASRAKERMIVISTIRGADIDAAKAKNAGSRFLKGFLTYAEAASNSEFELEEPDPSIANFIQRDLMRKGYDSDLSVGSSGFKIDLAIKAKGSDEYVLGVLLDGEEGRETMSTRDRFYVSPAMLGALKWKIVHVYTLDYLRFPASTVDSIVSAIGVTDTAEVDTSFSAPKLIDANEDFDYRIAEYNRYKPPFLLNPSKYEPKLYYPRLANEIMAIIAAESPISAETLKERVKELLNNTAKKNLDQIIGTQLGFLAEKIAKSTDFQTGTFYWVKDGNEGQLLPCRHSAERDLYNTPKEEIVYLMNRIIEAQGKISREDLIRLTSTKMEVTTLTKKAHDKIEYCLDWAIQLNLLRRGFVEAYDPE